MTERWDVDPKKKQTQFHFSILSHQSGMDGYFSSSLFSILLLKPIYVKGSAITWQILSNDSPHHIQQNRFFWERCICMDGNKMLICLKINHCNGLEK